jgi:hypothetical protein
VIPLSSCRERLPAQEGARSGRRPPGPYTGGIVQGALGTIGRPRPSPEPRGYLQEIDAIVFGVVISVQKCYLKTWIRNLPEIGEIHTGRKKMKRFLAPMFIFLSIFFMMGMGEMGGAVPADKTPTPEKNFAVRVTDREGIQTSLNQFSQDGKVSLTGKLGSATVSIPFEKISQVQVQNVEGNDVQIKVSLRNQESLDIKIDKKAKFYGKANFGSFQVEVKDLKALNFLP